MDARCTKCSKRVKIRLTKGVKMSDMRHKCAGSFEKVIDGKVIGFSPNEETTETQYLPNYIWMGGDAGKPFYTIYTNSSGDRFIEDKNTGILQLINHPTGEKEA